MSRESLRKADNLLMDAQVIAQDAGDTLNEIGMCSSATCGHQGPAFRKAAAKLKAAHKIVAQIKAFKKKYGDFA